MRRTIPQPRPVLVLLAGLVLVGDAAFAQVPALGGVRVNPQNRPARPDPFDSIAASAASFDMDAPVEAHTEFVPPVVRVGGQADYRVTITALLESLKLPDSLPAPPGLELSPGGQGQIYEPTGNAKLRPVTTTIFHVTAASNGTFTIPAFEALAYGKPVKIPEATLKVVAAGEAPDQGPLRLILDVPAGDIFAGQTLRLPLALPVPDNLRALGISQPRAAGDFFFSEQALSGMHQEIMRRNNRTFTAFVQDVMVTPLREGRLELVGQAFGNFSRPVPGQSNAYQMSQELLDSDPVVINVQPLPEEGRLPGFTGGIGHFQIDPPKISTNQVRAGEPLQLTVMIHGDGNLGRLIPPPPPSVRDWQSFPPLGETVPAYFIQARGFASFSYTLIPTTSQIKATPAIPFCYFDPTRKAYVDLTIPPVPLTVTPSPGETARTKPPPAGLNSGEDDASDREKDLVLSGLAAKPGVTAGSFAPLQERGWFLAFQLFPAAALAGLWAWDRRRRHLEAHPEVLLKRRARRGLSRELRLTRRAAAARDAAAFVNGATNALREACAPHGAANPSALVCADVLQELPEPEQQGRPGEMIRRLFAAADALRFGGAVSNGAELFPLEPELERVLDRLRARL